MIRIPSMYAHCSEQCTAYLPESFIFLFTPSMYKYGQHTVKAMVTQKY